jgi:hypothetical protein
VIFRRIEVATPPIDGDSGVDLLVRHLRDEVHGHDPEQDDRGETLIDEPAAPPHPAKLMSDDVHEPVANGEERQHMAGSRVEPVAECLPCLGLAVSVRITAVVSLPT